MVPSKPYQSSTMLLLFNIILLYAVMGNALDTPEEGLTRKEKHAIVERHNDERSKDASAGIESASNMRRMRWSRKLAETAQEYANKCIYEHSDLPKLGIGENLYITTANLHKKGVEKGVSFWYNEKKDYHLETGKCEPGKVCGHYMQVVWSGATRVGCGLKLCDTLEGISWKKAYYLVCNYNKVVMKGKKPFVEAESCSNCPDGYKNCSPYRTKNLCLHDAAGKRSDLDQTYSFDDDDMVETEERKRSTKDDVDIKDVERSFDDDLDIKALKRNPDDDLDIKALKRNPDDDLSAALK